MTATTVAGAARLITWVRSSRWIRCVGWVACALTCLLSLPAHLHADDDTTGVSSPPDDARWEIVFAPELTGAFSTDVRLFNTFTPFDDHLEILPDFGIAGATGWRHYLDAHGAFSISTRLRGGATFDAAPLGHVGLEAGLHARGYNAQYLFLGGGLVTSVDLLVWNPDAATRRDIGGGGAVSEDTWVGWRLGLGLETTAGMLWFLRPYLFGEIGAIVQLELLDVGPLDGTAITGRWLLRFDWAQPTDPSQPDATWEEREELFEK